MLRKFGVDPSVWRALIRLVGTAIKDWGTTLRLATIMVIATACVAAAVWVW